ncbi:hypothetical protein AYO22_03977 [Fonsecaea multimorphosa]|nr:hypothetical protein AYO22_03977 [Fonsecaea multimorphosa]
MPSTRAQKAKGITNPVPASKPVSTRAQKSRGTTKPVPASKPVSTRVRKSKGVTTSVSEHGQVKITAMFPVAAKSAAERTMSASVHADVAVKDTSTASMSSDQTMNESRSLIVRLKVPGVADTKIVVAAKRAVKGKAVDAKGAGQRAAATSRGFKRESSDEDNSPHKKSKRSRKEDDDDFEPDDATTQALAVATVTRELRGRGEDGTVTGRIRDAEKAKEDLRGPFISLRVKLLGQSLEKTKKRRPATRYTNAQRFKFGHDQLWYWTSPSPYEIRKVSEILEKERPAIAEVAVAEGTATNPFHASAGISIDSIVRVILSQASTNEGALDAQQSMLLAYPYWVDGKRITGKKPNYHAMRLQSLSKLEKVLKKAGLGKIKPKAIKQILDIVYQRNMALLDPLADGQVLCEDNEPGATDFVPGLLSVDYFWDIYRQQGKQALLDHLVSFPSIGVKSASCLMSFNMSLPVFAVDTHVAGMAKLLDKLKLSLHQAFWNHRRNCARCSARNNPSSWIYNNTTCPLESMIKRPQPKPEATKAPRKPQTAPPKRANKKEPSDEERIAQGLVKVTYEIDDDFDAAGGTGVKRTIWIRDYSAEEYDPVEEEDIYVEEIIISFSKGKK